MGNMIVGAGGGGGQKQHVPVESPDSLHSIAYARIVDLVSEGEIVGWADLAHPLRCIYFNETPLENGDGTLNFHNVQVDSRVGTQVQDVIPGFDGVQNEINVGLELKQSVDWVQDINNTSVTAVRVTLSTPMLSYRKDNGDLQGYSVRYEIWLATDGGAYVKLLTTAFNGKTSTKYQRSHLITLPPANAKWTIKVKRITADSTDSAIQSSTYVDSYTEIVNAKLRMPMSAVVQTVIDAKQFSSIPTRAFHMKGRILQVPTNYDPVTRTYSGVWDGTFKLAYSNNPAWVWYDMAINDRYGLGKLLPASRIDKWALYTIAKYCDELVEDGYGGMEPRFTANLYLQTRADALKVMQDMATMFRGIMYAAGGALVACGDMPSDPIYTFTPANVEGGKFTYAGSGRKVRHTVALVSWNDMSDFGRAKVEYVEDPDGILRYGVQETEVIAIGCTSRGQAHRFGKYILATERYETDALTFQVGLDGTIPAPGKIVNIVDPIRAGKRMGGRVNAATINSVTVDLLPEGLVAGDSVTIILPTGVPQKRIIQSIADKTITVTVNFTAIPAVQSVWMVEKPSLNAQKFRVLGVIEAAEGNAYTISAIQHVEEKFDFVDFGTKIDEPPISVGVPKVLLAPGNVQISKIDVSETNVTHKIVTVTWNQVAGAVAYEVLYRQNGGSWRDIGGTTQASVDLRNLMSGPLDLQVTAIAASGLRSQPTFAGPFDVTPNELPPGYVAGLETSITDALTEAQNAQATADGKITSFYQATPPVIGSASSQAKEGDIWFDTDDGNKLYRVVSGAWALSADDDLAAALDMASDAQATADGKVQTFFSSTAPTATAVGDLWFNTSTKKLLRWDGSAWSQNIGDVTADQLAGTGANILWSEYSQLTKAQALSPSSDPACFKNVLTALDAWPDASAVGGFAYRATTGGTNSSADYFYMAASTSDFNLNLTNGKYIVSFYAKSLVAGQVIRPFFRGAANKDGTDVVLTTVRTRYVMSFDFAGSADDIAEAFGFYCNRNGVAARTVYIDGVMIEPAIGNLTKAGAFCIGPSVRQTIVAIANAATAQATADGKIDTWYQASPPAIGSASNQAKEGDIWFDTDDGNKIYTVVSGAWTATPDSRIAQAITDAAGAQATADGKVKTFYQSTTPTATGIGDLWFHTVTKVLYRWSGSAWASGGSTLNDGGVTNGVVNGISNGANLVPNPTFVKNVSGVPLGGDRGVGDYVADDWNIFTKSAGRFQIFREAAGNTLIRVPAGTVIPATSNYGGAGFITPEPSSFAVTPGKSYRASASMSLLRNVTPPASFSWITRFGVSFYDVNGNSIAGTPPYTDKVNTTGTYTIDWTAVAPASAVKGVAWFALYYRDLNGWTTTGIPCDMRVTSVSLIEVVSLDDHVEDGTTFGRVDWNDLYQGGGRNRIGLRWPGSGHRIGDQRNLPQSNTTNYGSVRSTSSLTATSAGAVSVNAHSVRYGSVSVAYSAVANAVTGLTVGNTYIIYCFDGSYSGGVKQWFAGANPDAVMQLGDDVVVAGQITIPSSGSSSGGGGGTGLPGTWCVDYEFATLPDGRFVRDLQIGDMVPVWDGNAEDPGVEMVPVRAIAFGEEESSILVSESLIQCAQSNSTPMDLRHGGYAYTQEMMAKEVLVREADGTLRWEVVTDIVAIGKRKVVKVDLGGRMYFVGVLGGATMATHNAIKQQQ